MCASKGGCDLCWGWGESGECGANGDLSEGDVDVGKA